MADWNPKEIDADAFTKEQALAEVARELTIRVSAYPKFIDAGRMTIETANRQQGALKKAYLLLKQGEQPAAEKPTLSADEQARLLRSVKLLNAAEKLGPNPEGIIERIIARGGVEGLKRAYKLLDLFEAGTDMSAIVEIMKAFPGSKIAAVNDPPARKEAA
jgi:hypothetical protein